MTPAQLELIPSRLIFERGTEELREWLYARGWQMTLLELTTERERRSSIRTTNRPNGRHHR